MEQALCRLQGPCMMDSKKLQIFGVRHLSPAGAWHLRAFLDQHKPKLVLIEGPDDFNDSIMELVHPDAKPPIAILAYTAEVPVRSILYPLAEYSPEYQAILWCKEHQTMCRFMDLPAAVTLAMPEEQKENGQEEQSGDVYELLDQKSGEDGHEMLWERMLEHTASPEDYHEAVNAFGREIRSYDLQHDVERARDMVREAYMRRVIAQALGEGYQPSELVIVTGAYHVEGLLDERAGAMTDEELKKLPHTIVNHTLMPYSYFRLSTRAGYGAGNKAPAYYGLIWESFQSGRQEDTAYKYLTQIAAWQRTHGNPTSSAEVIEAVRLAKTLAGMRGSAFPVLRDLRDAAVTCLGGGSFSAISLAVADTEIGTGIGELPEGVSRTSIQEDFYRRLKRLHLEKYRDITAQDLPLDLRENRMVKSEEAAFLDLHRSFFLHQLRVLGVSFAKQQEVRQDNATWAEKWVLRWSPEAEIELVESALLGDTVLQAASLSLKERVQQAGSMADIAAALNDAFLCGMAEAVSYATSALQAATVEAAALAELACTAESLSYILQYGSIRKLNAVPVVPILEQVFFRSCLLLPGASVCDEAAANDVIASMERLNKADLAHDFLNHDSWNRALTEIADRDDCNTKLSGYSMAVLLERGLVGTERLKLEVSRRLSPGVPADLGAGWFEGLALKNRYALIARLSLWESLDTYLDTLDEEEFKRALLYLRRAFADFSAAEKDAIAENLGEIWGLNGANVSEAVNAPLTKTEEELVESLDSFDFDF